MTDLRRDPILGQWIVVAKKESSLTPADYIIDPGTQVIKQEETCQFCPGREKYTPPEVDAFRPNGSAPNSSGWMARVIPNKFPALKIEGHINKKALGIYDISNGIGAHEVLIETNDHRRQMPDLTPEEIGLVMRLCQNRSLSLERDRRFKYIMIFKNFGESAGASVEHSHTQIIALPMVPKLVLAELEGSRSYFQFRGRCVYCDIIEQEYGDEERIIAENEFFVAFCPFVPRYPFECWVVPKNHDSNFCYIDDRERYALASIMKDVLQKLKACLSNPPYNFYLHVPPIGYVDHETFHWHIEIVPKITRELGYEWGTGFYLVTTEPSVAAQYLKGKS